MGPRPGFKVSTKRLEKREINLGSPELVVQLVIHYTILGPAPVCRPFHQNIQFKALNQYESYRISPVITFECFASVSVVTVLGCAPV